MVRTAVFDWDGTLHDTIGIYGSAIRQTCRHLAGMGYTVPQNPQDDVLRKYLGVNPPDMWHDFAPGLDNEAVYAAVDYAGKKLIEGVESGRAKLYSGALDVLSQVRAEGISTVFLSNCTRDYMLCFSRHFSLENYFDAMYCCEDYGYRPKEEIFCRIMERFREEYVVIGDRLGDLKCAIVHKTHSIGCAYGFGSVSELASADFTAAAVTDIPQLIKKLS